MIETAAAITPQPRESVASDTVRLPTREEKNDV